MASIPFSPANPVARPENARELADLIGEISIRGGAITPVGGGTKQSFGNLLARDTQLVSTAGLNTILAYEPDDMTISVEAGVPIGAVWNELGARGQTIPIDVPNPEVETIGGLIATGLCGPRRYGSGSLRDALIGIQVAYPNGTLGNAGGMVVKNVSGFDLMRMHLGALGTLGVVVSANFKVLPAARAEATVVIERSSFDDVAVDRLVVARGRIRPIAFEARLDGTNWIEAIRIEGRPSTVEKMARELADGLGDARVLNSDDSVAFWKSYAATESLAENDSEIVLQVRNRPSNVEVTRASVALAFEGIDLLEREMRVSVGLGTVRLAGSLATASISEASSAIETIRRDGSRVLVLSAPNELHALLDVFGTPEPELELARKLKRQFDPTSAMNPGRVIPEL